jgi:cytochrome b561
MASITQLQPRATAMLYGLVAISIAAVGVLGVLQPPVTDGSSHGWIDVHALFGAVLLLGVMVLFGWHASHRAFTCARSVAIFARRLTRQVYLLLYALAALKEVACLMTSPEPVLAEAMKSLQCYVAYGGFALLSIKVLAALCHFYLIPRNLPTFHRL